jgi:EAL domain-containing protein (putative c-di-GMP-specific phosphodiesterase class I)
MWDAALADGWTGEGLLFLNASPVALLTGALWRCRHRVPAEVVIEVSEQHAIADYSALSRTLSDWAGFGAQVAVDDMGSGHANLRHVLNLAPRFLKLDRSLVADLHVTPARYALVESIARFAERTGSLVIAEGIETEEEARPCAPPACPTVRATCSPAPNRCHPPSTGGRRRRCWPAEGRRSPGFSAIRVGSAERSGRAV